MLVRRSTFQSLLLLSLQNFPSNAVKCYMGEDDKKNHCESLKCSSRWYLFRFCAGIGDSHSRIQEKSQAMEMKGKIIDPAAESHSGEANMNETRKPQPTAKKFFFGIVQAAPKICFERHENRSKIPLSRLFMVRGGGRMDVLRFN